MWNSSARSRKKFFEKAEAPADVPGSRKPGGGKNKRKHRDEAGDVGAEPSSSQGKKPEKPKKSKKEKKA